MEGWKTFKKITLHRNINTTRFRPKSYRNPAKYSICLRLAAQKYCKYQGVLSNTHRKPAIVPYVSQSSLTTKIWPKIVPTRNKLYMFHMFVKTPHGFAYLPLQKHCISTLFKTPYFKRFLHATPSKYPKHKKRFPRTSKKRTKSP